ncbi:HAD family hydrolase [Methanoregula sp.]|uniref:HAD family hydrolase n=1 Tax=Methanoregula sp. TaxID=2052170 RepID=UPI003C75EB19
MISTIIFDFDGVILESVTIKTEAFRVLFSDVPEHVDEIVQFHRDNGGMSRFDKIRYIYKNILKKDLDQVTFETLSEKFSNLVFHGVLNAPFVPGAAEFLKKYSSTIPLYVVSATPEKELREIMLERNLTPFFKEVYGAPRKKNDCIDEILSKSGVPASDVLFVGDALNDLAAAQASGVAFIGRVGRGENDIFRNYSGVKTVITDLNELPLILERPL